MLSSRLALQLRIPALSGFSLLLVLLGACGGPLGGGSNGGATDPPPGSATRVDVRILGQGVVNQNVSGTNATLTAVSENGWEFSEWSGADVPSSENPITVDLGEVASITATFVPGGDGGPSSRDDRDGDGVADADDNCVIDENPFQEDTDLDGRGDLCDVCPMDPDDDRDGDGVCGDVDNCPGDANPDQLDTDDDGVGDVCEGDRDGDGVVDDDDNCPDATNADQTDSDGDGFGDACDIPDDTGGGGGGGGGGGTTDPVCGNGVPESGEACDDGNLVPGDGCDEKCELEEGFCGDGHVALSLEECDDGNNVPGDGCDANCLLERPDNDDCADAIAVFDGDTGFDNILATTDGPDEPATCDFGFGTTQVAADIWFCYEATCNGTITASLCGSDYDTKLAVYDGCTCPPTGQPLACSDDDCGAGAFDSRLTFSAVQGQSYMIRIGGFTVGSQGPGTLALRCDTQPLCDVAAGDCFATGGNGSPGCDDANCCETTCAADPFCCDVTWDSTCAAEAQGLCTGSFPACSTSTGACDAGNGGGGCEDESCCNLVCAVDPFCCVDTWDGFCATEAASICGLNCGTTGAPRNNACDIVADPSVNIPVAGCSDETTCKDVCTTAPECCLEAWSQRCVCLADPSEPCCAAVCAVDDFCCTTEWDDFCDEQAADLCTP